MADDLPEFRDWSRVAVQLRRGVVYREDDHVWNLLLSNVSALENHFARIGLRLVVVESDGMAYVRQLTEDEATGGSEETGRTGLRGPLRRGIFRLGSSSNPQSAVASIAPRRTPRRTRQTRGWREIRRR